MFRRGLVLSSSGSINLTVFGLPNPEDGGTVLLRNVGKYLPLTWHNIPEELNPLAGCPYYKDIGLMLSKKIVAVDFGSCVKFMG
jgi:hypothetical protein